MRWNFYITGIILILLGVLTFRYPVEAIMSVGFFIGLGLVASGLNYFSGFYFFGLKRFIALGLLDLIMGAVLIAQPGLSAFFMPFVIGLWFLLTGVARSCASFWLGGAKVRGWWCMLLNGLALIVFGLLICASPLVSAFSIMMMLSAVLVASGVLAIVEGNLLYN
ncbi:MAG: DUF308 domain-containing protein [Synergistaceae bacterium]|nr:DUF308 domain-containing protein [Synergistaceae bacterium]MBR0093843.1 DUF308 domain-containing protein [Synergistaceae bacterium]